MRAGSSCHEKCWHAPCLKRVTTNQTNMRTATNENTIAILHSTTLGSVATVHSTTSAESSPPEHVDRAWGNGVMLKINQDGILSRGAYGSPLESVSFRLEDRFVSLSFAKARFVGVGLDGKLRMSTTGRHWHECPQPPDTWVRAVTASDDGFVAVGGSFIDHKPVILWSSRGHDWARARCPRKAVLLDVVWGDGMFVAGGDGGLVLRSSNGSKWKVCSTPTTEVIGSLSHMHGRFVAGGGGGLIMTSSDGRHWTALPAFTREYIGNIVVIHNLFQITANGTTFHSSDGIKWISRDTPGSTRETLFAATQVNH